MAALLRVNDLHVSYGAIRALHGVSFHVDEGEVVTLIGANGAGKSTTLRTISALLPVDKGASPMRVRISPTSKPVPSSADV